MSARPRVLLTRRWTEEAERRLASRFDVTLNEADVPMSADALAQAMREYDAICPTVTDSITAAILGTEGRRVKLIGNFGVGYNHIDVAAAGKLGIRVSNTPDVLTDTTADLAILLMLMATRRAGEGERELRGGRWTGWRPTHMMGLGLQDKTLGLIGYGRIAQATARRAHHGFGMRIVYNSRRRVEQAIEAECAARFIDYRRRTGRNQRCDLAALSRRRTDASPDQRRTAAPHEAHGRAGQYRARHRGG